MAQHGVDTGSHPFSSFIITSRRASTRQREPIRQDEKSMAKQAPSQDDVIITKKAYRCDLSAVEEVDPEYVDSELKKVIVDMQEVGKQFEIVVGDVLTLIDASMTDKDQKKALKSLIKVAIYEGLDNLHALSELYSREARGACDEGQKEA